MENTIESNNKQIQKIVLGATASIGTLMGLSMGAAHADSVYTVKANDTLDKIAQANKISLTDLEKANKSISNPNLIFVNQKINIPNNSQLSVNTQNVTVYTIQAGDTLFGIAQKFGTDIQSIKADNNLASDTIYPGEQLKVKTNDNDEHQQQTIHIPDVHPEVSAQTKTNGTYTVQAGDSVYSVAKKHNMSVDELRDKNSMSKTDMLKPNSTIKVNNVSSNTSSSESNKAQTSSSNNDLSSFSSVTQNAINEKSKSTSNSINSMSQSTVTVKQDNVAHAATTPSLQSSSVNKDVIASSSSASQSSTPGLKSSVKASEVNNSSQADYNSSSAAKVNSQNSTSTTDNQQANTQSSQATQTTQVQTQPVQQTPQSADNNQATQTATNNQQQNQTQVAQTNTNESQQTNNSQDNKGEQIVNYAEKYVGTPYVWGGTTPAGFDCSGFTQYVYNHNGYNIGRTTYDQCKEGPHVDANQAQAGDLLFWGSDSAPYHVGISMGGDQYIAAPEPGENVKVGNTQYYQPSYAIHYNQVN